ncbi:MAG: uracil-DNA glycosylase [Hyphomicrobiaceae bacterium]
MEMEPEEREELLALLAWWRTAGVDAVLDEAPSNWTRDSATVPGAHFAWPDSPALEDQAAPGPAPASRPAAPPMPAASRGHPAPGARAPLPTAAPPQPARPFLTAAPDAATMAAREAARAAPTLDALCKALAAFDGCSLKATAKNLCFYRGAASARLMLIGEAPGRDEDLEGKPFVGRSGQLLDRMLAAIGLSDADVHITNTVYWRPPGNRTPTPLETLVCKPFLERQIALVAPDIIVTLGGPAAKAVLGTEEGILKIRGKWRETDIEGRRIRIMPTLHPAYLLRTPIAKRQAWRDLLAIKAALADNKQETPKR